MKRGKIIAGMLAMSLIAVNMPVQTADAVTVPGTDSSFDYVLTLKQL